MSTSCINRTSPSPRARRRGTMMLAYVVMIPVAIALLLLVLTRVTIALRETRRIQQRAQARLLAESALAVYCAAPALPIRGEIEGVGAYRVEPAPAPVAEGAAAAEAPSPGSAFVRAHGELAAPDGAALQRVTCEILARVEAAGAARPFRVSYGRAPVAAEE